MRCQKAGAGNSLSGLFMAIITCKRLDSSEHVIGVKWFWHEIVRTCLQGIVIVSLAGAEGDDRQFAESPQPSENLKTVHFGHDNVQQQGFKHIPVIDNDKRLVGEVALRDVEAATTGGED